MKQKFYDLFLEPINQSWSNFVKLEEAKMNFYVNIYPECDISSLIDKTYHDFDGLMADIERVYEREVDKSLMKTRTRYHKKREIEELNIRLSKLEN